MMFHIALCDDNANSIEILEKYFDKLNNSALEYDVYFSADELYNYKLKNHLTYDIYILDIEMHGMNGIELAKKLRTDDSNALIIFLTNYSKYVFDVFDVITFDFLIKPINFDSFQKVIYKSLDYLNMNKKSFSFSYCKINYNIAYSKIIYINKSGRKAFLHTKDTVYQFNMTLEDILARLDLQIFGKIHNSCIVNLGYIQEIIRDELILKTGESLFVSRNYRQHIKEQHLYFLKKRF
uniref:LytR/AlgR family response regulator transcription factor n=1 Tax=Agathobacter sp. TaxID=2021311 RepID=UPI004056DEA5